MGPFSWTLNWTQLRPRLQGDEIDTKIEVIVVSPTTWEAHHNSRAKPEGCGEFPRSLVTPQWSKSRHQFLFFHDVSKHIKSMQIWVSIIRKSFIKLLWEAWPLTIVTAASLVTSCLPLWCHSCNSISALTIKPWLGAERLLLVSDLNTNKTTITITITSGLRCLGFYMDHRVTGSCWRDSWA